LNVKNTSGITNTTTRIGTKAEPSLPELVITALYIMKTMIKEINVIENFINLIILVAFVYWLRAFDGVILVG